VGLGSVLGAAAAITTAVIPASGISPPDLHVTLPGVAAGLGVSPDAVVIAATAPGTASGVGFVATSTVRDLVESAGHRGTLDALEALPGGMQVVGAGQTGIVMSGVQQTGT
jgi:hypothetical protein